VNTFAGRTDRKRRRFFLMKRAEGLERRTARLSGKYVPITSRFVRGRNLLDGLCRDRSHAGFTFRSCYRRSRFKLREKRPFDENFVPAFRYCPGLAAVVPAAHAREVVRKATQSSLPSAEKFPPPLHLFLRRAVKAAENAGASALIIDMNTYGGRLDAAADICAS